MKFKDLLLPNWWELLEQKTNKMTIYIHNNQPYGSIKALSDSTGIKPDKLYTAFGRNKQTMYIGKGYTIYKTTLIRS